MRRTTAPARAGLLVGALTLALAAISAAPAGAAKRETSAWDVTHAAHIAIVGHGYGHGHGMSQYGAEGAARQGLTYQQIAEFYYAGTQWGTAVGRVTVQITADSSPRDLVVRARSGLTLRDTAVRGRSPLPENGATAWRVVTGRAGVGRVSYLTDRWHPFATLQGTGEFFAGGRPITLVTPSGDRSYRGRLRTALTGTGTRATVNELRLEKYLRGVVPLEIPASWSTEAVRAQAVAARTYAAYERAHPRSSAYQICDTTSCQVYGGVAAEHRAANRAIRDTRTQVLTVGGEPAFTQFGSSSGGWTAAGSVPYLAAREDPYDGWAGNPVHDWTLVVTDTRLEQAWPEIGDLGRIEVTSRDGNGAWGGRVGSITLTGTGGQVTVSGDTFRSALGLRSTWLTFTISPR
ncbi:SpoIID/LytB domain-containing protein [Nocardioides sp. YIM 152315]|uniref:SpoIID/LytB domain-containing protein n=1 Tax=Nocardioides sp. YIM 152315 TaxID=3031760 RepID=UPI0023DA593B|nr:SpoIID/LytB domain-containing protein [Nocardioides sp. YIM 152315]MDF1602959.1 SpoIID/LytB domain-containing protein [Nocardioides sp. YIM 152315]